MCVQLGRRLVVATFGHDGASMGWTIGAVVRSLRSQIALRIALINAAVWNQGLIVFTKPPVRRTRLG
jgi:hypothetical protein